MNQKNLRPDLLEEAGLSPQSIQILLIAAVEASSDPAGRGEKINPEHILIGMAAVGNNLGSELVENSGLTIKDLRAGNVTPKKGQ